MIVYQGSGAGNFTIEGLVDPDGQITLKHNVVRLLRVRSQNLAAQLLSDYDFEIFAASNDFMDDFYILQASLQLKDYEKIRLSADATEYRTAFVCIAKTYNEIGTYIRFINVELAQEERSVPKIDHNELAELVLLMEQQKNAMISVSTGGPRINEVNQEFRSRQQALDAILSRLGFHDTNPHKDLWDWYGKWSSGDLPTYRSRRQYINDLFNPFIERLNSSAGNNKFLTIVAPTGWGRVDRTITEIRRRLSEASIEEQYQAVGLLCRECLISLAQAIYEPKIHYISGEAEPSNTDSKRMLEYYIRTVIQGSTNETFRSFAKSTIKLADELVHKRTADFRSAGLCVEATAVLVNTIAIISGRRDQ